MGQRGWCFSFVLRIIVLILFSISLLGCHDLKIQTGHYEGLLIEGAGWTFHSKNDPKLSELVGIEINRIPKGILEIQVKTLGSGEAFTVLFKKEGMKAYSIALPRLGEIPFKPKKYRNSNDLSGMECYSDYSRYKISLCLAYNEFKFSVEDSSSRPILILSGGRFHRESPFSLEEPRVMSASEAVKTALQKDFGSRIEYQHLMRARDTATAAYLNLIPHVRIYTGLSVASFAMTLSPLALLNDLNDFGPFLFPGRWLQASAAKLQAKAAEDSFRIMRANLGNQVEGFIYNLESHKSQYAVYENLLKRARETLAKVAMLEKAGKIEHGATATLQTVEKNLEFGQIAVGSAVATDRQAISMSLGFLNPAAIENIVLDHPEVPMDQLRPLNIKAVAQTALNRSMEARQLDFLISAAEKERVALMFNWLDPAGNPFTPLGFNLIPQMKAATSQIQTLVIQKEQRKQDAVQKGLMSAARYNRMIEIYRKIQIFKTEQESRLEDILTEINAVDFQKLDGQPFLQTRAHDVQEVFQDLLASSMLAEGYLSNFRALRTSIERLLLIGYFSQLSELPVQASLKDLEATSGEAEVASNKHDELDQCENEHFNELLKLMTYFQK